MPEGLDQEKIAEAVQALNRAYNTGEERHVIKAIEALETSIEAGEEEGKVLTTSEVNFDVDPFLTSGTPWLDEFLGGGLRRKELAMIGGESYSGKTHWLTYISAQFILGGYKILHFNGEDILSDILLGYRRAFAPFVEQDLEVEDRLRFVDAVDMGFSVSGIVSVLERLEEADALPDIVVVDHMDLLYMGVQDWTSVSKMSRGLKFLAKRFNLVVLTASQYHFQSDEGGTIKKKSAASRLFGGAVSKFQHLDLFLSLDGRDTMGTQLSLAKARGRKIPENALHWIINANINTMQFDGIPEGEF